jgi:hypothetical protein
MCFLQKCAKQCQKRTIKHSNKFYKVEYRTYICHKYIDLQELFLRLTTYDNVVYQYNKTV